MNNALLRLDESDVTRFMDDGVVQLPNPLGAESLTQIATQYDQLRLERMVAPDSGHPLAMRFMALGSPLFELVERSDFVDAAKTLLDSDRIFVGACGIGNTMDIVMKDGRSKRQIQWHSTPGPNDIAPGVRQVAFRFGLDHHDASAGRLHVLPGTHREITSVARERIRTKVAKSPDFYTHGEHFFGTHPQERRIDLSPEMLLLWTPDIWHCTGESLVRRPRRALTWIYIRANGRFRDRNLIQTVYSKKVESWSPERRALWGLED